MPLFTQCVIASNHRDRLDWRSRTGLCLLLSLGLALVAAAGPAKAARPRVYAIQGARIVVAPGKTIDRGTVVVRDGTIAAVGANVDAPPDAELVDGKGLTVYAGLIDPYTHLGMPKASDEAAGGEQKDKPKTQEKPAERGPGRDNLEMRADARAALLYKAPPAAELEKMHALGFTSAMTVPESGAFRGTGALVHLNGESGGQAILVPDVAAALAFETAPGDVYPTSIMGVIALIRQSFEDAKRQALWEERWKKNPKGLERPPMSPTLDAVEEILKGKRVCFEAEDTHAFGRIVAIAKEYSFTPIVVGNGYEYEIEQQVKRSGLSMIVPVAFPEPPHVEDADAALDLKTRDLRRWDLAPWNPSILFEAHVPMALTTYRLRNLSDFSKNVRKAIEKGLPADAALEALTVQPAKLLGVDAILGTVEAGKIADLVLADGDLFAEKTQIKKLFIDGTPITMEEESKDFDPNAKVDPRGSWEITYSFGGRTATRTWKINGTPGNYTGTAETQSGSASLYGLSLTGNKLTGSYKPGSSGAVDFTWIIKGEELSGRSVLPDGTKISYSGRRVAKPEGGNP